MSLRQDYFNVLRKIKRDFKNQRQLAKELKFSLGKLNYCLLELRKKGLVKIESFKKDPSKIKMNEYEELKKELKDQKLKKDK